MMYQRRVVHDIAYAQLHQEVTIDGSMMFQSNMRCRYAITIYCSSMCSIWALIHDFLD